MATYTIFSDSADGSITSNSAVSWNATRAGNDLLVDDTSVQTYLGEYDALKGYFEMYESFLSWDTSVIVDSETVTSATVSIYGGQAGPTTWEGPAGTLEARAFDWGATLTAGDWVAGASLSGLTLLASFAVGNAGVGWAAAYNVFTSQAAFLAAVNKTGSTRLMMCTSDMRSGTDPGAINRVIVMFAEASGTTQDPKLVVNTTAGSTAKNRTLLGVGV